MTFRTIPDVLSLEEAAHQEVAGVGRKAHTLGVLLRSGFPVPPGVVIRAGTTSERLPEVLEDVSDQLNGPLAVRSSALHEDLGSRSYAGQYETVLWVEGPEALLKAVRRVRASGDSERVRAYHGGEDTSGVAVLIQEMVPADVAGVAFTANPVTGERDVTLVSAVRGVGERLVSGEVDPDDWEVRGESVIARRTPGEVLDEDRVRNVARLAEQVAATFDTPQDIEWAIHDGQVYLLQARPVTGLADVAPLEPDLSPPGEGFWMLDGGHYPSPVSPMGASFYLPALEEGGSAAFRAWGLLVEGIRQGVVGWRVYVHVEAPPDEEAVGRQIERAREALEGGRMEEVVTRWWEEWRPAFREEIDRLASEDLPALDDEALVSHLRQCIDLVQRGQRVHFELFPPYMVAVAEMMIFCAERLGWPSGKAADLAAGLSEMSSEPARRLAELAELARAHPDTAELLDKPGGPDIGELRRSDDRFAEELDAYLAEFGMRATAYDVIAPTLGEQEEALVAAIRGNSGYDPGAVADRLTATRRRTAEEAREALGNDGSAVRIFDDLLERLERVFPVREDNIFFTDNAPVGLVRLAALEMGRRLAARDLLEDHEHVVFLTVDEAVDSLLGAEDRGPEVERRRGERIWAMTHTPAPMFGQPAPPPDPSGLPEHAARLMKALGFFMENDLASPGGEGLSGTAASAGTYMGPVRVIGSETEFGKVRNGDVLVCPITTPAWSVLFGRIGALVTDTGGLLSHSAIVAREHGLPAVVSTGSATSSLRDGQIVTVDGSSGEIRMEEE